MKILEKSTIRSDHTTLGLRSQETETAVINQVNTQLLSVISATTTKHKADDVFADLHNCVGCNYPVRGRELFEFVIFINS